MSVLASIQCPSREDKIVDGELVQDFATTLQYMSSKKQHIKTISDGFKVDKTEIKSEQKMYDECGDNEIKLDVDADNIVSFIKTFSFFNDQFDLFMESIRIAAKFDLRIPSNEWNNNSVITTRSQREIIHEIILHTISLNDEFTKDLTIATKLDSLYMDIINNYDNGVELINSFINLIC